MDTKTLPVHYTSDSIDALHKMCKLFYFIIYIRFDGVVVLVLSGVHRCRK